ncbi:MAG TPA: uracil-DNA glycosylase [Caldilineae bacterium]|nr:uracil-DNA glycosylase [Caldilineae bacterium]
MSTQPEQDTLQRLSEEIIACRACPRLVTWREEVARVKRRAYRDWTYWGKPVPGFGDPEARLLIIGLAPGAHGANRTGRMFTGDDAGTWLMRALHRAGFANRPRSEHRDDGLCLHGAYITAVVRCVPPKNRPTAQEITNCRAFLQREIRLLTHVRVVVTLGRIAFDGYLAALREMESAIPRLRFSHGMHYHLSDDLPVLIACYHTSRQNTQTGRLTEAMLDEVFARARSLLTPEDASPDSPRSFDTR